MTTRLRYGVLLSSTRLARWHLAVLDALDAIPGVELCVVVTDERRPIATPFNLRKLRHLRQGAWMALDARSRARTAAFATTDASERLAGVPHVGAVVRTSGIWQEFADDDLAAIAATKPDLLLRFGFGPIRGPILEVAPHGVWSFHHDDEQVHRGGPPCFWELYFGEATTGVTFQRLTERLDGGIPLAKAWFRTIPHSLASNRNQAYLGAAVLPAQVARRILLGADHLTTVAPSTTTAPVRRAPTNAQVARFAVGCTLRFARQQWIGMARADRWNVAVVPRPVHEVVADPDVSDAIWFPRQRERTRYIADPFGCTTSDGRLRVVVEDLDHRDAHGFISSYEVGPEGRVRSGPHLVERLPTHVSYPGLTRVGDEWWLLPESAAARDVRAFRYDPDADTIEPIGVLLDHVSLKDPTLFEHEGRWWLMGTDGDQGSNTHLRAWWSADPHGPWELHAMDPLVVDVRAARPAGAPFRIDGQLHRPAQDNSRSYGGALTIHRIDELTPHTYGDEHVATLAPARRSPYPDGLHTINALGDLTLIDGVRHRFDRAYFASRVRDRLRR